MPSVFEFTQSIVGTSLQVSGQAQTGSMTVSSALVGGVANTLKLPSYTTAQRALITSPIEGDMIYNSSKKDTQVYRSGLWTNLGVPAGTIQDFAGSSAPDGWVFCNGAALSRTDPRYVDLFAAIGTLFGHGNGSTTFNIPDARGRVSRCLDAGAGADPEAGSRYNLYSGGASGNSVGSYQDDKTRMPVNSFSNDYQLGAHEHRYLVVNNTRSWEDEPGPAGYNGVGWSSTGEPFGSNPDLSHVHSISGGDAESRMKNFYVLKIIKL